VLDAKATPQEGDVTVLVIGEALIDLIVAPDGRIEAVPGGGPFNVARTVARLGVPVAFGGGISDDAFGRRIAVLLEADGVSAPVPTRVGHPTTLALAELDDHGTATYRFYLDATSAADVRPDDLPTLDDLHILAVGTLGLVMHPLAETVDAAVAAAGDRTIVFVDPNCRPGTVSDEAAYRALLGRLFARADVVKVSGDDLAYLDPDSAPIEVARAIVAAGARVVLFTDGSDMVRIVTPDGEATVPVPLVDVVDTVGAGDSFGGAFLAFWESAGLGRAELADLDVVRATVSRAIVVAGITCTRAGADPPRLDELPA
jgi:fructokinase